MCCIKKRTRRLSKRKKPAVPANATPPVQFIRPDDPILSPNLNWPNPYPSPNRPIPYPIPYPNGYPAPNGPDPYPGANDPIPYPNGYPSPNKPNPYLSPNKPKPYLSPDKPNPYPSPKDSNPYPGLNDPDPYPGPNDLSPYPNGWPSPKSPSPYPIPKSPSLKSLIPYPSPGPDSSYPYHSPMPSPNSLCPLLQVGSGMRYDVRMPPQEGIAPSTWQQISLVPALEMPTFKILIISKAFPWSIVIYAPTGSVVTCGTIFEELHKQLQRHVEGPEWAMLAVDKTRKEAVEKAARSRQEKDKINRLKRIDWLGDKSMFEGLERDKEFEKKRHLPGSMSVTETWVVRFGKW